MARFNANVDYSGLVHAVTEDGWFKENKEKLIHSALTSLLTNGEKTDTPEHLAGEFLAIRRLVASKAGFQVDAVLWVSAQSLSTLSFVFYFIFFNAGVYAHALVQGPDWDEGSAGFAAQ